jgi:hypothetical protein
MDGTGVPSPTRAGPVNCEYGIVDSTQKFKAEFQANGSCCFESVAFPGIFLCLNGTGLSTGSGPGGTVNCQPGGPGFSLTTYDLYIEGYSAHSVEM